ncbi:Srm, partial [Symbiodinium sp. KB8]
VLDVPHDGWFTEEEVMWPGQRMSLKVENVLERTQSQYQDILVFQSATYGKVLVLDGVVQITERDEASYQECITHIPLMAHPHPKRVLIVGGGDGGVLREVCKHPDVEEVVMCEIDEQVVACAKRHLSDVTATAFGDSRLTLRFQDAAEYVKTRQGAFDVVIMDSSDPVGPAESLYEASFLGSVRSALNPGGILCMQGECLWLHADFIRDTLAVAATQFAEVDYAFTGVPTYPCGQIGFILCKGPRATPDPKAKPDTALTPTMRQPVRAPSDELLGRFKYYTPALHAASFVLPAFMERKLTGVRTPSSLGSVQPSPWGACATALAVLGGVAVGAAVALTLGARRRNTQGAPS